MLPLRPLGQTGLMVSPIGLGTVKLGRSTGVRYPSPVAVPDDAAAEQLLAQAGKLGINLIDTAPAYGNAEERLGSLLRGQRDQWVIVTKAGEEFDPATGESSFDFSPAGVTASVERSLRRLRTDRLDVVLLHSGGRDEWIINESGAIGALDRLQSQGKTRSYGISTKSPAGGLLAVERCPVVMLTLNVRERADLPAVRAASGNGVGVLVKKGLLSGHLRGAGPEPGGDPASASLRFILGHPGVSSVVVGTINPAHLEQNARAAEAALRA